MNDRQKSIEELVAEQGVGPIKSADDLAMEGLTAEDADLFMPDEWPRADPAAPFDVERLAKAMHAAHRPCDWEQAGGEYLREHLDAIADAADAIVAEYARLSQEEPSA